MSKQCEICSTIDKNELSKCPNCKKKVCRFCRPSLQIEILCIVCVRSKIREEMIAESLQKRESLQSELWFLIEKGQKAQFEIEFLMDKAQYLENFLKSGELTHLEKINSLEIAISKAKSDIIPYSTIDNLETAVEKQKNVEKTKRFRYQELADNLEAEEIKLGAQKECEKMQQRRIEEIRKMSSNCVPYEEIRSWVCEKCGRAIKGKFRDAILSGNNEKQSLVESVLKMKASEINKSLIGNKGQRSSHAEKIKRDTQCVCAVA